MKNLQLTSGVTNRRTYAMLRAAFLGKCLYEPFTNIVYLALVHRQIPQNLWLVLICPETIVLEK